MLTQMKLPKKRISFDKEYADLSNFDMENAVFVNKVVGKLSPNCNLLLSETYKARLKTPIFDVAHKDPSYYEEGNYYYLSKKISLVYVQLYYCLSKIYEHFLPHQPDSHIVKDGDNNYYIAERVLKDGDITFHEDVFQEKICGLATIATLSYIFEDSFEPKDIAFQTHCYDAQDNRKLKTDFILPFKYQSSFKLFEEPEDEEITDNLELLIEKIAFSYQFRSETKVTVDNSFREEVISTLRKIVNNQDLIFNILKDNLNADPFEPFKCLLDSFKESCKRNPDDLILQKNAIISEIESKNSDDIIKNSYTSEGLINIFKKMFINIDAMVNQKPSLKLS
jgi:hypothetical protein